MQISAVSFSNSPRGAALRGRRQTLFPKRAWTKRGRRGDTPLLHFPQVPQQRFPRYVGAAAPSSLWAPPPSAGQWCTLPPRRGDPCGRPHLCRYLVHFCTSVYFFDRRRTAAAPDCSGPFLLHFFATRDVVCNGRVLSGWFQGEHRQRSQKQYACRHRYPGQPVFLHQRAVFLPVLGLDCRPYPSAAVPQHPCRRGRQYQTVYHRLLPFFRQRQSVQIAPPPLPV